MPLMKSSFFGIVRASSHASRRSDKNASTCGTFAAVIDRCTFSRWPA